MQREVSPSHRLYIDSNPSFHYNRFNNLPIVWDNLNKNSISSLIDICHQLHIPINEPFIKSNLIRLIEKELKSIPNPPEIPLFPSFDYITSSQTAASSNETKSIALSRIPDSYNQQTSSISSFFGGNSYDPRVLSPFAKIFRSKYSDLYPNSKERTQLKIENKDKNTTLQSNLQHVFEFSPKNQNSPKYTTPTTNTTNNNNTKKNSKNRNSKFHSSSSPNQQTDNQKPEKQFNQKKATRNSPKSQTELNQPKPPPQQQPQRPPPEPNQIVVNKNVRANNSSFNRNQTNSTFKPDSTKQQSIPIPNNNETKQPHQTITIASISNNEINTRNQDSNKKNETRLTITKDNQVVNLQKSTNQQNTSGIKIQNQPKSKPVDQPGFIKPIPLTNPDQNKPTPKPENQTTLNKPLPMNQPEIKTTQPPDKKTTEKQPTDKKTTEKQPTDKILTDTQTTDKKVIENQSLNTEQIEKSTSKDAQPIDESPVVSQSAKNQTQNKQNQQPKTKNKFDRQNNFFYNNAKSNQYKKPKLLKKDDVDVPSPVIETVPKKTENEQSEDSADSEPVPKEKKKKRVLLEFYGLSVEKQRIIVRTGFVILHLILFVLFYIWNDFNYQLPKRL